MIQRAARMVGVCLSLLAVSGCGCGSDVAGAGTAAQTWTLNGQFSEGTTFNLSQVGDALQLSEQDTPCEFVNVAASGNGTVVRIEVNSGVVVGEYRSAPEGRGTDPSRTTVDLECNVWCSNRAESGSINGVPHGSCVKIGVVIGGTRGDKNMDGSFTPNPAGQYLQGPFSYNTCVDRDGDGLIRTSSGLGDILPWPDLTDGLGGATGVVEDAADECILLYQRLPDSPNARHMSVDSDNNIWVGGYPFSLQRFHKLHGDTAAFLDTFHASTFGAGGYGGLIDGAGIVWSASLVESATLRYDPVLATGVAIPSSSSYGMGVDNNGNIWNSKFGEALIMKFDPAGTPFAGFPKPTGGGGGARGVAVTGADNHIWVANSFGSDVSRLDNDGNLLKVIPVGSMPTGVAVDSNGKVWVTNYISNNVMRIDPAGDMDGLGAVDLTVPIGSSATPYNYSDMTGAVVFGTTAQIGTWTVVFDSGTGGQPWGVLTWNTEPGGSEPPGTSITVEARASDTLGGLVLLPYTAVGNGVPFAMAGRFIQVRVTLQAALDGTSPVLSDIALSSAP